MTLYLKKLSFIESYPFKSQGKRYYHDIQRDKILIKFQLIKVFFEIFTHIFKFGRF